jgi:hypothetical protein
LHHALYVLPGCLYANKIIVAQSIGGAIFVSVANSIFTNHLIKALSTNAPNTSPRQVLAAGSVDLSKHFHGEQLSGILLSYMQSLQVVFLLVTVLAGVATVVSFGTPWISVKKDGEGKDKQGMAMGA